MIYIDIYIKKIKSQNYYKLRKAQTRNGLFSLKTPKNNLTCKKKQVLYGLRGKINI